MENYMPDVFQAVQARDPNEREYLQAVSEVMASVKPVLDQNPAYRKLSLLERMIEPERIVTFRVPWMDDQSRIRVNRGFRIEMSSAIGPYKGGLRFHPSVNQSILKFLAFDLVFKNALTTMPLGAGSGGSDFDPKGKSDGEVMRFCQAFMAELHRHIGSDTDIPTGDIGVGSREIGYLFGMYRKLRNEFTGAMTGKSMGWGGSLVRREAPGYGCVYFVSEMLAQRSDSLDGKVCLVSGSGNVAQHVVEKLLAFGAKVVTLSDSSGYIYDEEGIDVPKLEFIKRLKNVRRGRIGAYVEKYPTAVYSEADAPLDHNPLWHHRADCAFPCAMENDIREKDAYRLINNNVKVVCEGANMPCTPEAMAIFLDRRDVLYAPGKAANAGGMAISGLEMTQNSIRLTWTREELESRLRIIMKTIHDTCRHAAEAYGTPGNLVNGANIAGFIKVADAMIDQGVV
jgi:glutamate dehydrogenase (NADP+)